jgi:hypothetical protein
METMANQAQAATIIFDNDFMYLGHFAKVSIWYLFLT